MAVGFFSISLGRYRSAGASRGGGESGNLPLHDFIADKENILAGEAARILLANEPRYNPLFFYGPTGTGKSHLVRGLAVRVQQSGQNRSVLVMDGADFVRACSGVNDADALSDFLQRCRSADLLVIDHLEELAERRHAQQELIGVLDALLRSNGRLVVTSRCPPQKADWLVKGLRSRLMAGLTVPLKNPGLIARQEILEQLFQFHGIRLETEILTFLADELRACVQELNHAVVQLLAESKSRNLPLDIPFIQRFLVDQQGKQIPTLATITSHVSRYYKLKSKDLKSATRQQSIVRARGMAMYLARRLTDASFEAIGSHFGRRDHTTVLHAYRKTEELIKNNPAAKVAADELLEQLARA